MEDSELYIPALVYTWILLHSKHFRHVFVFCGVGIKSLHILIPTQGTLHRAALCNTYCSVLTTLSHDCSLFLCYILIYLFFIHILFVFVYVGTRKEVALRFILYNLF